MLELEKNPNPIKDQHFLVDQEMLNLIYNTANIQDGESIIEIGGGSGALTDYLVQGNNFVTVIEKDPYYYKYLKQRYAGLSNVQIIEGDALDYNFESYDRLVANLPYTITEPFLINLASSGALEYNPNNSNSSNLKSITLVLSQNSLRKMVAPVQISEGKSKHLNQEFGIMSAICKSFCDIDIVSAIPSRSFYPEPAVTSFVVNITPKKEKTTVDRIMRELLIDKKNNHSTVKRLYQLMLVRGEIYKISKHKKNLGYSLNLNFTSSEILNHNIYSLNHSQISQLVQDLIRNDISIKAKNSNRRNFNDDDDYTKYFVGNKFVYNFNKYKEDDFEDNYDDYYDDYEINFQKGIKEKFIKKYDYMYNSKLYDILLHRGLENLEPEDFILLFQKNEENDVIYNLSKRKILKKN